MEITSSCPFVVSRYSTRGGISLNDCLSRIPAFWSSLSLAANVLLLMPFRVCRNCLYLTGSVLQHSGISISIVPLFVIRSLNLEVSDINANGLYPSNPHVSLTTGNRDLVLVSMPKLTVSMYPRQFKYFP